MTETEADQPSLNDRFTAIADSVSSAVGHYLFTIVSVVLLVIWTVYGLTAVNAQIVAGGGSAGDWFTSQAWNFPLNTVTTVGEWFLGALIAAASNRIERRNREINERELAMLDTLETHVATSRQLHEASYKLLSQLEEQEQRELHIVERLGTLERKVDGQ